MNTARTIFIRHTLAALTLGFIALPVAAQGDAGDPDLGNAVIRIERSMPFEQSDPLPSSAVLRQIELTEQVTQLVAQLDDPAWTQRQAATQALIKANIAESQLYAAFEQLALSPEQRQRLLYILRERITNAPRGAMGIRMDIAPGQILPAPNQPREPQAVTIIDLIPGMPAERVLQIHDMITHIDDVRIGSPDDLIVHVQGRRPGDTVQVKLLRPQRDHRGVVEVDDTGMAITDQLEVELELGSFDDLHDPLTGAPAPANRLTIERRNQLAAAMARYGAKPRTVSSDPR
jgi:hypothetical protein